MVYKSSIALLFLALTSSVNAAPIAPRDVGDGDNGGNNQAFAPDRQFFLSLV